MPSSRNNKKSRTRNDDNEESSEVNRSRTSSSVPVLVEAELASSGRGGPKLELIREDISNRIKEIEDELNDSLEEDNSSVPVASLDQVFNEEYYVEKIVDKYIINNMVHYETKWDGYPEDQNTKEKLHNLKNSLRMIKEFERRQLNKPDGLVVECYDDSSTKYSSEIWAKMSHCIEPNKILAFDFRANQFLMSWKNTGDVTAMTSAEVAKKYPKLMIDFFQRNRDEIFRARRAYYCTEKD